ncbi:polysaccharide deacetylase family protein [Paenibacillus glacialis]|uniref:Polysaccharide deacetylase n=1 Tax=Paenibacillus glacialis TaxID=494026 RepID=A0A162MHA8_9BACL|nr:polysaccharide deacetylase family protein [Paenibacillus glacialis]OAB44723.1 polysaccharide deacetylase [Paenibacillus glacialis]
MNQWLPVLFLIGSFVYMMIPVIMSRVFGLGVYKRGRQAQQAEVAFTFDDGPDPRYTPELLDLLKQYDVLATFFVLGSKAEQYPHLIRRIHDEGHQIGIHNYIHKCNLIIFPWKIKRQHINRTADIIEGIIGERPSSYRPPWGVLNLGDLFLLRKSYYIVLWSVMGWDWKRQENSQKLIDRLLRKIKPGSIVLLHDSGDTTGADEDAPRQMLEGLRIVLQELKPKQYSYVRTDTLLKKRVAKGYPIDQNIHATQHIKSRVI